MTTHTPGPWKAVPVEIGNNKQHHIIGVPFDDSVASTSYPFHGHEAMAANACLIAAAPDLLDALQNLVASCTEEVAPDGYVTLRAPARSDFNRAVAAIAKATAQET